MNGWLQSASWLNEHALTALVVLPLAGCCMLAHPAFSAARDPQASRARLLSLVVTLLCFALSLAMLAAFEPGAGMQFRENAAWIPNFGISYALGVDGISLSLILLTALLMPLVVVASRSVKRNARGYLACMLFLQTAVFGTLAALDLFLFYIFWELMLAPMYFIIGIWGGERRIYAALKFVLYTIGGSFLMLIAIFYLVWRSYQQTGEVTFLLQPLLQSTLSFREELWLFAAFAVAFAVKVPVFPFHTWLPDAHVEAPTGGSVVLAGILLKMGIYGFLRFAFPLFPRAGLEFAPYLAALGVIGIVYGAFVAWAQSDIKKLVAYSSVSHLGYCVLGMVAGSAAAIGGSVFQMISHGLTTGALFFIVGVLYERRHTRQISEYGGLAGKTPRLAFFLMVFTLGSIALPLTSGFVGEFLILAGSFARFRWLTGAALIGVVIGAVYMLTLYLRTMYGKLDQEKNGDLRDLTRAEFLTLAPLLVLVLWFGVFPQPVLKIFMPSVTAYVDQVAARQRSLLQSEAQPSASVLGAGRLQTEEEAEDLQRASLKAAPLPPALDAVCQGGC